MKSARFTALLFICVFFLNSCAAPENNDVYYIHACGFDERNDRTVFTVLLEKSTSESDKYGSSDGESTDTDGMTEDNGENFTKYFTDSFEGENIVQCAQSFFEKYPNCYSGRNDVYLFSESLDRKTLYDIAVYIPSVPGLPAGSGAVCVSSVSCSELLKKAADEKNPDSLRFNKENPKINAVRFFAMCTSENKKIAIPVLKYDKDKNIHFDGKAVYRNCAIVTG